MPDLLNSPVIPICPWRIVCTRSSKSDLGRAEDAMRRFLDRLGDRPRDAQIYGGLVQALRFCSLLDASLAAHHTARHLDANVVTSVHHTWWMRGK
jgi:hypothetical protein